MRKTLLCDSWKCVELPSDGGIEKGEMEVYKSRGEDEENATSTANNVTSQYPAVTPKTCLLISQTPLVSERKETNVYI